MKDDERDRPSAKQSYFHKQFQTPDSKFPGPAELNGCLTNRNNKMRLQKLVKDQLRKLQNSIKILCTAKKSEQQA